MPGTVSLGGQTYEPVEIDLWGEKFQTVAYTRSVASKAADAQEKIDKAEDPDEIVNAVAELVDLRVKPAAGTRKASTVIKAKWKADELTIDQLFTFLGNVETADRPL